MQFRILFAFLTLSAGAGMLHADDPMLWRSWGVSDGLAETYSYAVSVTPGGSACIRHGAVPLMSVFDGYTVTRIPDPRGNAQPDWPSNKRVYPGAGGALWTTSLNALKEYRDGKWIETPRRVASTANPAGALPVADAEASGNAAAPPTCASDACGYSRAGRPEAPFTDGLALRISYFALAGIDTGAGPIKDWRALQATFSRKPNPLAFGRWSFGDPLLHCLMPPNRLGVRTVYMEERSLGLLSTHTQQNRGLLAYRSATLPVQTELRRKQYMQVESRHLKPKIELAALYRQRELLVSLIQSMERYQRATGIPTRASRYSPRAA